MSNNYEINQDKINKEKFMIPEGKKGLFISVLIVLGILILYFIINLGLNLGVIFFLLLLYGGFKTNLNTIVMNLIISEISIILLIYYVIFPRLNLKEIEYKPLKKSRLFISLVLFFMICLIT